jgi:hypothetical protein
MNPDVGVRSDSTEKENDGVVSVVERGMAAMTPGAMALPVCTVLVS